MAWTTITEVVRTEIKVSSLGFGLHQEWLEPYMLQLACITSDCHPTTLAVLCTVFLDPREAHKAH